MKRPRRSFVLAFLAAATAAVAAGPSPGPAAAELAPPKPELKLKVTPHHGYLPLEVKLTGELRGAGDIAPSSCTLTVEWKNDEGPLMPWVSKEKIACLEVSDVKCLPPTFKRKLTLSQPGLYSYRILIEREGEAALSSASVEVKVIRSPVQVNVPVTGGGSRD